MTPSYIGLHQSGELQRRIDQATALLGACRLCPRGCGVNRLDDGRGLCGVGRRSVVASFNPHFGEEGPLVGEHGSGTIFFAGCNLGCVFCQNYDISHDPAAGQEAEPDELAGVMLELQRQGCHNINFVTPSHVVAQILEALPIAIEHGLSVPLVYNTSSYDSVDTLKLLSGVVDIYMPDVKIWDPALAKQYLRAKDYPERARAAVREMHAQVGDLVINKQGLADTGMLVRHLVMPDSVAGTESWMCFLAELSTRTYVNIMDQYRPCGQADLRIGRMITKQEMDHALAAAARCGIDRLDDRGDRFLYQMVRRTQ